MPYISKQRRQEIVTRLDGSTSRVTASAIRNGEELAYAIRFLTDHFVYKRSKGLGSPNAGAIREAGEAVAAALSTFAEDVADPNGVSLDTHEDGTAVAPVSRLGEGVVENPFNLTV